MPPEYRAAFDEQATRLHAAIVARRGARRTHVEMWQELSERLVAICVVADDRPGLLSCISAALVGCHIDVAQADAYCRTRDDGRVEAVDFLWIRRLPDRKGLVPPIHARDIVRVAEAIEQMADGAEVQPDSSEIRTSDVPPPPAAAARIRFDRNAVDGTTVLTVEAKDRPGLLLAVTQALFRAGLQIVGLRATTERGAAVDRFTLVELDGSPLGPERLLTLQTAILGAIDEGTLAPYRKSTSQAS
jgi:[protein-PII] uridylyltransferase